MSDIDLPVRDPSAFPGGFERPDAAVHGVVLAAGTSDRFGHANKLLQAVDGTPVVRRATATLAGADLDGVTVVVGHEAEAVRAAVESLDVAIRINEAYAAGQSTSVRAGVTAAAERGADAVLVALGDMPWVDVRTVDTVIEAYRRGVGDIVVAACDGTRGNPVLFDRQFFDALAAVEGDTGGRQLLLDGDEAVGVETGDAGVRRDVDSPGDLPE